jgi:hypothetical protein
VTSDKSRATGHKDIPVLNWGHYVGVTLEHY